MKEKTCLALYSGGLDSLLAVRVMLNQGVNVIALNFDTGFFFGAYDEINGRKIYKAASPYEITVVDVSADFIEMIKNPAHGFGKNMNPCIDCKIMMLKKAKELMTEYDAGYVITGEVLGQRPMTQNIRAMKLIEKESGLEGFLLRPLCAKNMPATEPEKLGWVDRGKLLDLKGRGRTRQLELAKLWGMEEFVKTPAGGCILTDENFSKKLKDHLISNLKSQISSDDMKLLRLGRHFRKDGIKFIIGRNKDENKELMKYRDRGVIFDTKDAPGPITLAIGEISPGLKSFIAAVTAGYSDAKNRRSTAVEVSSGDKLETVEVEPIKPAEAGVFRVG